MQWFFSVSISFKFTGNNLLLQSKAKSKIEIDHIKNTVKPMFLVFH